MLGSGRGDGDVIAMGPDKPRRTWGPVISGRGRRVLAVAGACVLLAAGITVAAVRLSASAPADPALARLITAVTTVPAGEQVPAGTVQPGGNPDTQSPPYFSGAAPVMIISPSPTEVSDSALTRDGKPEVLIVGTGICPSCAGENWALIVALSRFGTFSGLRTSRFPAFTGVAAIDSWTFRGSSYASRYLAFVPVQTRRLTPAEQAAFTRFNPGRLTPFLDFGGQAVQIGSGVAVGALAHLTWNQIAARLRRPTSPAGATIITAASTLTAQLCRLTRDRPAAACAY